MTTAVGKFKISVDSFFFSFGVPEISATVGKFVLCSLQCKWDFGLNVIVMGIFQFQNRQNQW